MPKKLSKDGFEVHAVSVNTGGFNDQEIKNQQDNALKIGATKYTSLDGLDNYYNKVIRFLVFGNILKMKPILYQLVLKELFKVD